MLVVGAGAWGSALANVCARAGSRVCLWDADPRLTGYIRAERRHPIFSPEVGFESNIVVLDKLSDLKQAECVLFVVPFQYLRAAMGAVRDAGIDTFAVACASKGFELSTHAMGHEIAAAVWSPDQPFAQLSGPNFAAEVMSGAPAAMTVGASTPELGALLVRMLHSSHFRPYPSDDVLGVEIGGALKNIIAIAAGIADGLGLGSNTQAALITRGLAEISRFGCALGARTDTFAGLSGMGDLVLTCTDNQSRNRRFGVALAAHGDSEKAAESVGALVEGVTTAKAVAEMARLKTITMPIVAEVDAILARQVTPAESVTRLMARDPVAESV